MALTYKNLLKGHIVQVPEPADILAAAEEEAERLFRKGTKRDRLDGELITDRARAQALHQRQTLAKMDESRRWERYVAPPVEPEAVNPPAPEPVAQPEPVRVDSPTKAAKATMRPKETETEA